MMRGVLLFSRDADVPKLEAFWSLYVLSNMCCMWPFLVHVNMGPLEVEIPSDEQTSLLVSWTQPWGIPFSMLEGIWCKPSLFIENVSPIEDVSLIDLWSKLRFQLPCYQGVYLLEARINHCRFGDQDLRTDTASDSQRQRCHGLLSEFDVSKRVRPETMNIHEYPSCTSTFLYYVIW